MLSTILYLLIVIVIPYFTISFLLTFFFLREDYADYEAYHRKKGKPHGWLRYYFLGESYTSDPEVKKNPLPAQLKRILILVLTLAVCALFWSNPFA